MHTPFRNAKELINSVIDIGAHIKKGYIGKIEEYNVQKEADQMMALDIGIWELDMLEIQNMFSLKTTDFIITPKDQNADQLRIYSEIVKGGNRFHLIS